LNDPTPLPSEPQANVALYAAKRAGHAWALYRTADDRYSPRQLALRAELPKAIANGELRLYFQPKAIGTGVVVGVEALVRWQHPQHGLMTPDQFVHIAEHGGLIGDLTAFVIRDTSPPAIVGATWGTT
jgi:sensor c-di-GMP phosphodiesterase-like protein